MADLAAIRAHAEAIIDLCDGYPEPAPTPAGVGPPWPKQDAASMNKFYGNPDANQDGLPDVEWESANLINMPPPYRMLLSWDTSVTLKTIRVHWKCADSLLRVLNGILKYYGSQAAIDQARMHLYGGMYNFRHKTGGSSLSIHSWGAAIDLDPEQNGYGDSTPAMPKPVVDLFKREQWIWGGDWTTKDGMHFQAAIL